MTKTLISRGGALSALALVLALATPAAALAQDMPQRQPDYSDPPPMRIERPQPTRAERPAVRSEPRPARMRQQAQAAEAPPPPQRSFQPRAERPGRPERPAGVERRPNRDGFGADVLRRAERAAAEPERPAPPVIRDTRPARGPIADGRRDDRRDGPRGDRVGERGGWQGRDRSGGPAPVIIDGNGDRRIEQPVGRRIGQGDGRRNDDWRDDRRDGRRDGDWRDGRRDNEWRDGDRRDFRRDRRNWRRDDWRWSYGGWNGWDRHDFRRWDNRWRSNRAYDWYDFRRGNRFQFRPGPYFAPYRSHRYNRLNVGFFLDSLFFQPRFFINDPWSYHLPPVYGPYQWVRYYDDVLLVDIYTGEVVDVIHDFFW
ncbi:MAG: RcnB family protein [Erythrobacter sp.]